MLSRQKTLVWEYALHTGFGKVSSGLIIAVSCLIFILSIVLVYLIRLNISERGKNKRIFSEKNALINLIFPILDKERERISQNIHDDIGSVLAIIKLNLSQLVSGNGEQPAELIGSSISLIDQAIKNTRGIAYDLMPPSLSKLGFEKSIVEHCRQLALSAEIQVMIHLEKNETEISSILGLHLFRVIQELLNNIMKHSGAKCVEITIRDSTESILDIVFSYDGKGISHEKMLELSEKENGIGLKSILNRLRLLNGTISYLIHETGKPGIIISIPNHERQDIDRDH
jgi:two-component system NarL family sensor kinase